MIVQRRQRRPCADVIDVDVEFLQIANNRLRFIGVGSEGFTIWLQN